MRRWLGNRLTFANAAAMVSLVLAAGGGGYALAASSGDGQVHACVGQGRSLHLRRGRHCPRGQRALNWSVQGPQGIAGATGGQGIQGPQGPGARSFNGNIPINSQFNPIATANGVRASLQCDGFGHINMRVEPASGDTTGFYAFGTQVIDGAETVVSSDPAGIQVDASRSIEVHVTVAASVAKGPVKLTRFDFSDTNTAPTACPYRGLVIPGDAAS